MNNKTSTRHADGVSQTDGATVNIDFSRVNAEHFDISQDNNTEGFVNFPESDVLDFDTSIGK